MQIPVYCPLCKFFVNKAIWCFFVIGLSVCNSEGSEVHEDVQALLDESRTLRGTAESAAKGLVIAAKAIEVAIDRADERGLILAREDLAIHQYFLGEYGKGMAGLGVALASARFHKFVDLEASLLNSLGIFYWKNGDLGEALRILKQTVELATAHGFTDTIAPAKNNMGIVYFQLQEYHEAIKCYEIAIELNRELKDDKLLARYLSNLAEALIQVGELDRAEPLLNESMAIEKRLGNPVSIAYTYFNFGEFYSQAELYELPYQHYMKALEMQKALDYEYGISMTKMRLAQDFEKQGEIVKAHEVIDRGLLLARRLQVQPLLASYYEILSDLARQENDIRLSAYYQLLAENLRKNALGHDVKNQDLKSDAVNSDAGYQAGIGGQYPANFLDMMERGLIAFLSICLFGLLVSHLKLRRQQ